MKKYIGKYKKEGLPGGPNEVETTMHGFIVTNEGQWKYPGQPTLILSNEITMNGVDFPVLGVDDTGHSQIMMPGTDYSFPGSMVYELPMAQSGKSLSQNWKDITGTPWSKAKELGLTTTEKAIKVVENAGKKVASKVQSFEEGGSANNKIYLGKYTMGPNKFQTGGENKESYYRIPSISNMFEGVPESTLIEVDPITGEELSYVNSNYTPSDAPQPMDYNTMLHRQAFQESSFRDDIITGKKKSPAGAMGLAQFMPNTVEDMKRIGLVGKDFDPYDTVQAATAQRKYMDWLGQRPYLAKGDPLIQQAKVLGAYNAGPGTIKNILTKAKNDGYDIYNSTEWLNHPSMPSETKDYIEKILLKSVPEYEEGYESVKDRYRDLYFKQSGGALPPDYELFREHPGGAPYAYEAPQVNGVLLPDPNRPRMQGTNATEYKVEWDGITMPSVVNGNYLGPEGAYHRYLLTGEHYPELADPASYSNFYDIVDQLGLMQYGKGGLKQWFAEEWKDIKTGKPCGRGKDEKGRPYPACRPTKRVSSDTPKTSGEMSASEKRKFRREKRSSKRISYNHKRNNA